MFKTVFIRIITDVIEKTFIVTTTTSITRVILIIDAIFVLTIKSKQETFKEFIYYIYNKIYYYKKHYTIQD